jgi:adenine-specific DNA-methyltransferase
MQPKSKTILKSLDKAYKIQAISRPAIENFKTNYIQLMDRVEESESHNESEENFKGHLMDFLKNTYYTKNATSSTPLVAPKGKTDFVIHTNHEGSSPVAVLFEVKRPKNIAEMVTRQNLNTKAMHELMLYYLEERTTHHNNNITHLVITNIHEWFIFEANTFENLFYKNSPLLKDFKDWKDGKKVSKNKDLFYKEIAKPALTKLEEFPEFTYFDIRTYEKNIRNTDTADDTSLIQLYKIFSPTHLLKLKTANDTNKLNHKFYAELLHIIGLEEVKEGSKKLIQRKEQGKRDDGALLENCITILENEDRLHHVADLSVYGKNREEHYFNIGLELCITWINRVLFLKLLEAQLQQYKSPVATVALTPDGGTSFATTSDDGSCFLNAEKIKDFDVLNKLFFQVLAKPTKDRSESIQAQFKRIPYLNSSLFEISALEDDTIRINSLDDSLDLNLLKNSVLRNNEGFKNKKNINTLQYLFAFLDAYDFSSENQEDIIEENRELISASVLGLIFEKINGYRDGSFYTPAFITEYMCKETITKAVLQKFNETKNWNCATINDLHNRIEDIQEANHIFDSLHICDPAVGSGHFLVSALNVLIALKSELGILKDQQGKRLKNYHIEVIDDELVVLDEEEKVFNYRILPNGKVNTDIQRVQETLFHQKQTLIENCLFGVDINPNSVKICRLRLWIELLKNAYYTTESGFSELETLPNIDINIKQGNSLVSRYKLDEDLTEVFQKQKFSLATYRDAVQAYKDSKSKGAKAELLRFINEIKEQFKQSVSNRDPRRKQLSELRGKRSLLDLNIDMFGNKSLNDEQLDLQKRKFDKLILALDSEITDVANAKIYRNSFEWRFEFPEVLNEKGDFVGFDVVIGNPPYLGIEDISWEFRRLYEKLFVTATGRFDLYSLFIERAMQIKSTKSILTYIIPGKFLNNKQFALARRIFCENHGVNVIKIDEKVFEEAQVDSVIIENYPDLKGKYNALKLSSQTSELLSQTDLQNILMDKEVIFRLEVSLESDNLLTKITNNTLKVKDIADVKDGVIAGRIKDLLFIDKKVDEDSKKLYFGKHLSKYYISDTNVWINYKQNEMMEEEMKRVENKSPGLRMRNKTIYEREKILSRFVAKEIIATYDDENKYYEHTLHSTHITDKRFKTKYILALFNSQLFKFYYRKSNSQGGDIFPQVRISSVENLPIKLANEAVQSKFNEKVNQILGLKQSNPSTDTSDLEAEIDRMVYKLYDLTAEEILIVEGK